LAPRRTDSSPAFDLDLGKIGFVEQQREFANERAVIRLLARFGFRCVFRLARHDGIPKLSVWGVADG
jgi:hypothetical protein